MDRKPRPARKKANESSSLTLEKVVGFTTQSRSSLSVDAVTGDVAYAAGCAVVVYDPLRDRQTRLLVDQRNHKTVSCIAFAADGMHMAVGESGRQPGVVVWNMKESRVLCTLLGHKFGISHLAFSPDSKFLVSVGHTDDGFIHLWDWKMSRIIGTNKYGNQIISLSFAADSSYFVTTGPRQVRFWFVPPIVPTLSSAITVDVRSALLGSHKENTFVDVCCLRVGAEKSTVFSVTRKGLLCSFAPSESHMFPHAMDKWVDLKTTRAFSITGTSNYIACGCADGVLRLFNPLTLEFIANLPKPPPLGSTSLTNTSISSGSKKGANTYPDVIACSAMPNNKLIALYSDHSMFIWDISEPKKALKYRSQLAHAGCIWGVKSCSVNQEELAGFPSGSFFTCSSDSTIRFWSISSSNPHDADSAQYKMRERQENLSRDMHKIIYTCSDYSPMKASDPDGNGENQAQGNDSGVRCSEMSPDGMHVAMGDRQGNLKVFHVSDGSLLTSIEAHDSEILDIDYSSEPCMLATGSRDRMIHIFDVTRNYALIRTLDDHSSSITCLQFSSNGAKLVSGSSDKSLIFRSSMMGRYVRDHQVNCFGTVYDVDIDATNKFAVATGGQDKKTSVYNLATGKVVRSYKAADSGEFVKVCIDPSGLFVASSTTEKTIHIFDFYSGQCVGKAHGHSELITGITFTSDCKRLISVSGDGCIFVWRLSPELVGQMKNRLDEMEKSNPRKPNAQLLTPPSQGNMPSPKAPAQDTKPSSDKIASNQDEKGQVNAKPAKDASRVPSSSKIPGFSLSDSGLPVWARSEKTPRPDENRMPSARGKWAERLAEDGKPLISQLIQRPLVEELDAEPQEIVDSKENSDEDDDDGSELVETKPDSISENDSQENPETLYLESMEESDESASQSRQNESALDGNENAENGAETLSLQQPPPSVDVGAFLFQTPAKPSKGTDFLRRSITRQYLESPLISAQKEPNIEKSTSGSEIRHSDKSEDGQVAKIDSPSNQRDEALFKRPVSRKDVVNEVLRDEPVSVQSPPSASKHHIYPAQLTNPDNQSQIAFVKVDSEAVNGGEREKEKEKEKQLSEVVDDELIADETGQTIDASDCLSEVPPSQASQSLFMDTSVETVKLSSPLLSKSPPQSNRNADNSASSGNEDEEEDDMFSSYMTDLEAFQESFSKMMRHFSEISRLHNSSHKQASTSSLSREQASQLFSCYRSALYDTQNQLNETLGPQRTSAVISQSVNSASTDELDANRINQAFTPWDTNTSVTQSSASIATSIGPVDVSNILERYSDLLLSVLREKAGKS